MIARRVVVSGRVQGVGFRWATLAEAHRSGVLGWVRNLPDGSVETFVQGDDEAVLGLVDWLRSGPATAAVRHAAVVGVPPDPSLTGFEIR